MNKDQFKSQVLKSYERGRLFSAFQILCLIIPVVLISLATCGEANLPLAIGTFLGVLAIILKWRGEEYGASVGPGFWAGTAVFSFPLVLHIFDICCEGNLEILFCALSGVLGGVLIGVRFAKSKRIHKGRALIFSILIASLTAALGCASLGIGATLGLFSTLILFSLGSFALKSRFASK